MDGRWRKGDYKIDKNFNSSYDLIKHNHHMPYTPLYRPGEEKTVTSQAYPRNDRLDVTDNKMASDRLPVDQDEHGDADGPNPIQSHRPDPRYGSAQGRRSESKNHTHDQGNDVTLRLDDPVDDQRYMPDRHSPLQANKGYQGGLTGSWTDRPGNLGHGYDHYTEKPWTHRAPGSPGKMVDPRAGKNAYGAGTSLSTHKHGGALLFIRFPTGWGPGATDNINVACQAFLKSKTYDMGGKFIGIARNVHDFGYPAGPKEAIAVYHFPNKDKAKMFFQYDWIIRQPDFPPPYGHAEMWIVSNAYLPDNMDEYNTFLLSEVMLHTGVDRREFFENFQRPFERYLSDNEVMPFIVCSYGPHDRESLRRHSYHHQAIVTCHLFKGPNHLKWLSDQDSYLKYRCFHNQMADEKCMVFTVGRDLFP